VFLPLAPAVMRTIVVMKLGRVAKRLQQHQNLQTEFDNTIIDEVVSLCTRAETGARNIDAIIDQSIAPEISLRVLTNLAEGKSPGTLRVTLDEQKEIQFNFA